ncbi:neuropeptide FF receptor 2 [Strongylocentrotus purpuratus]|uniref:G-protein coupled receptors family 1 profile domain-containing protein n=1 Tax=Strongylocentrotus purpuratus TaxID=7668 RepID=A0A7M7GQ21_STRPU|nr:neuropeptide FF receptor 2 [Strongylocentrotus purpuratus]
MATTEGYTNVTLSAGGGAGGGGGSGLNITALSITQATLLGICSLMIVISNTFILVILYKVKNCFEDMQQFAFKALAVTDFLTGIFCCGLTIIAIIYGAGQPFSSVMCAIRGAACTGLTNLSALLIACACFDRFIAVIFPLRYFNLVTMKRARIVLLVVCTIAASNGALSLLRGRTVAKNNLCLSDFSSERLAFRPSLVTSLLIFSTTLLLTSISNIKVMLVASGQSKRSANVAPSDITNESDTTQKNAIQTRRGSLKALRVLIVTTIAFFIAIFPWSIVSGSQFSQKTSIATPMARYVSSLLLMSNSWVNALIFATFNKRFRKAAKRVVFRAQLDGESTILEHTLTSDA